MTDLMPEAITPSSDEWPEFAPAWAATEVFEAHDEAVTFLREWAIPSTYRDAEPLLVIQMDQEFTYCAANGTFVCGEQRITAGPSALWADYRSDEVASTLRAIADALAPHEATAGATGGVGGGLRSRGP